MREILFIRHGATAGNLQRRYIGRTDEPLCELGLKQALSLREKQFTVDRLYVSPAVRTVQTARLVFPEISYIAVPELWETDFGDFEGKTAEELSNDPRYQEWVDNGCLTPVPNGESIAQFKARCCKVFAEILERLPAESTTAFVIHGGCIMAILEAFAEPKRDFYSYHIPNGAYLRCIYQQGYLFIQGCDDGTKEQL